MMKINTYFKESYNELVHKVTWPTLKELQSSAIIVMIASIIIAVVIFIVDLVFENMMNFIYSLFY
jgi:preprotein translocase subunit SecE